MTAPTTDKKAIDLHGPNLILDVKNFGPIAEAKNIEFKPMTVFVGPSNTGKTYLAMLLHAVLQTKTPARSLIPFAADASTDTSDFFADKRFNRFVEDVRQWLDDQNGVPEYRGTDTVLDIPISYFRLDTRSYLTHAVQRFLKGYIRYANEAVARYFDVDHPRQLTMQSETGENRLSIAVRDAHHGINFSLLDNRKINFRPSSVVEITLEIEEGLNSPVLIDGRFVLTTDHEFAIRKFAETSVINFPSPHYFRAGRTGLIDAYRELAATLIERATTNRFLIGPDKQLAVSFATSEFLQALVRLSSRSTRTPSSPNVTKLAEVLEQSVLRGKINVIEAAGITFFTFEKDGITVPLDRASSMVTELAPIVLFIRSFVRDGDLLIIDEPEAHLHPEAQQQMAAALAFMVRSGLRVLITTHSHYMVEQLGNFVAVSTLDEDVRKRALKLKGALGDEDIYLDETEVAVYDFATDKSEHGSIVETVDFNQDYGYFPRDHNWAIADQMNRTQRVIEARIDQDDPVSI